MACTEKFQNLRPTGGSARFLFDAVFAMKWQLNGHAPPMRVRANLSQ